MFLNTPRFPDTISYGSAGGPEYNTTIVTMSSGQEYRNSNWSYPRQRYDVAFGVKSHAELEDVYYFFHIAKGKQNGFRFKDFMDYTSTLLGSVPSMLDQNIGAGNGILVAFQLKKTYSKGALVQERIISKPISGTVLIAIGGVSDSNWTLNDTTGVVTFDADTVRNITGASNAVNCELITDTNHNLSVGNSVWLDSFTGDWAGLNNQRFVIQSVPAGNKFTINKDTTGYAVYSANGGATNTIPQTGEIITAGFEFDVPVRFDSDYMPATFEFWNHGSMSIPLVELRNE
jgi:uncharacterized protein (TIGR02217 family)